jgi:putative N6-adenine-specific DNA methylase
MRVRVRELREEARAAGQAKRGEGPRIVASDADERAVGLARENARAAGVEIVVEQRDIRDLGTLEPPGFVVTNPPYGERIAGGDALYAELARAMRRMRGSTVGLLAGTPDIGRAMGRDPDRWWALYNGPIECRLLVYVTRAR